jgi:hypothetical protein
VPHVGVDIGQFIPPPASHYLVATPTDTHLAVIKNIAMKNARILVEKPICRLDKATNMQTLRDACDAHRDRIFMVNQYAYCPDPGGLGETSYDYYNSGDDGLAWDCIQLIHLSRSKISLKTNSPVWKCSINGHRLTHEVVDQAYVEMVKDFISNGDEHGKLWGWNDIEKSLGKVISWQKDFDRRTSA